jgi:hypothetical protein
MMEGKGGRGKSLEKRDVGGRYNDFRRILYSQLPRYIVFALDYRISYRAIPGFAAPPPKARPALFMP